MKKHGLIRLIVTVLALAWIGQFLISPKGVLALWRLERECKDIEAAISADSTARDSLVDLRNRLKTDSAFIARQVRENLGYIEDGERVIKFVVQE